MTITNIEIYSLIILLIVVLDYCIQFRKTFTSSSYIWLSMIFFTAILSIFNIVLSSGHIPFESQFTIVTIGYMIAILSPILLMWYIQINYIEPPKTGKTFRIIVIGYTLMYFGIVLYTFLINKTDVPYIINHITYLTKYNYLLFLTLVPTFYITIALTIKHKFHLQKIWRLILTTILCIGGITIDLLNESFAFLTISYVLSILILYIGKYNRTLNVDHLTGVYNRRAISQTNMFSNKNLIAIYYIDIDKFKLINDTYGHSEGDKTLRTVANILYGCVRTTDYVIRYGGDEFVILANVNKEQDVNIIKNNINQKIKDYNEKNKIQLSLSIGTAIYKNDMPIEQFIKEVDAKMYQEKNVKKKKTDK